MIQKILEEFSIKSNGETYDSDNMTAILQQLDQIPNIAYIIDTWDDEHYTVTVAYLEDGSIHLTPIYFD